MCPCGARKRRSIGNRAAVRPHASPTAPPGVFRGPCMRVEWRGVDPGALGRGIWAHSCGVVWGCRHHHLGLGLARTDGLNTARREPPNGPGGWPSEALGISLGRLDIFMHQRERVAGTWVPRTAPPE